LICLTCSGWNYVYVSIFIGYILVKTKTHFVMVAF